MPQAGMTVNRSGSRTCRMVGPARLRSARVMRPNFPRTPTRYTGPLAVLSDFIPMFLFRLIFLRCAVAVCALLPFAGGAAEPTDLERAQFVSALALAETGRGDEWKRLAVGLEEYPLFPYLEYTELTRNDSKPTRAAVERFIARWPDTLLAQRLRETTLRELAKREDWAGFRALWADSDDRDLRCLAARARMAGGETLDYARDIEPLLDGSRTPPSACDAVFAWADRHGVLTDERIWQRIEVAAEARSAGAVSKLAALLDGSDRAAAQRIAAAVRDPATTLKNAATWDDTPRTRDAISWGLARYARANSSAAETLWAQLGSHFEWDAAQKNRVLRALATFRATSFAPNALARLAALPADAGDETTREWRVRVALAAKDWDEALAALDALDDEQKTDSRWRYTRARVLDKLDRKDEARAAFADAARDANFHGFLAADWIGQPYAICPSTIARNDAAEAAVAKQPDLARAFEWYELARLPDARREWDFGFAKLDEEHRRLAADLAYRRGWYDRAIFAFGGDPETQRLYTQRFPLARRSLVEHEARAARLDPAWVYGIIRSESAWVTDAHSHADAYGLMQVLPSVAKQVAKREKLEYAGPRDLFDPDLAIPIGTRYLAQMARAYDGSPWLASAAYNAGQRPVGRWIEARGELDPDFFIETIPYKETREYVARVLAFSVLYDWRMNGKVIPLTARMPRIGANYTAPAADAPRKAVACPASDAAQTPAPAA